MALKVETRVSGNVFILDCEGRIVFGDEGAVLRERIKQLLTGTPRIVINLSAVDHIDSGGIGILVGLLVSSKNHGGELKLVAPNRHVYDVLRRTSLDTVFKVYKTNEEAVSAFGQPVA
jgi:anti-sigma B factor antagonist